MLRQVDLATYQTRFQIVYRTPSYPLTVLLKNEDPIYLEFLNLAQI